MKIVYLGVGTNLGSREKNLEEAVSLIREKIGQIVKSSSLYETEPWGFEAEEQFLNMVLKVETGLDPAELLTTILGIEENLGRVRSKDQYSSRIIDIDILLYADEEIDIEGLKIPHPKIAERKFVLVPLCEIDPGLVHPVLKKNVSSLLESCTDKSLIRKYG